MALLQVFVGIDVSQDWLDVHVLPMRARFRKANTPEGWGELLDDLANHPQAQVAVEASGGYERGILGYLCEAGFTVHCLDPYRVRQFARAAGRRAKNDRIDAEIIARFLAAFTLHPTCIDPVVEELGEHVAYRRQLVEERISVANQARLLRDARLKRLSLHRLARLDVFIARLDKRLADLIAADPQLRAKAAVLRSLKGIGVTVAATVLALLPELGTIDRRKTAALVGVCPYDFESGKFAGQRRIAGGRKHLRNALYMATLTAVRHNPIIKAFYQRLIQNRAEKKPAIIAAMRKIVVILNARMRDHFAELANNEKLLLAAE